MGAFVVRAFFLGGATEPPARALRRAESTTLISLYAVNENIPPDAFNEPLPTATLRRFAITLDASRLPNHFFMIFCYISVTMLVIRLYS